MSNAITCVNQRLVVKNPGVSCLALMFTLSNLKMAIHHGKNGFKVRKYDESYTVFVYRLIQMVKNLWLSVFGESQ